MSANEKRDQQQQHQSTSSTALVLLKLNEFDANVWRDTYEIIDQNKSNCSDYERERVDKSEILKSIRNLPPELEKLMQAFATQMKNMIHSMAKNRSNILKDWNGQQFARLIYSIVSWSKFLNASLCITNDACESVLESVFLSVARKDELLITKRFVERSMDIDVKNAQAAMSTLSMGSYHKGQVLSQQLQIMQGLITGADAQAMKMKAIAASNKKKKDKATTSGQKIAQNCSLEEMLDAITEMEKQYLWTQERCALLRSEIEHLAYVQKVDLTLDCVSGEEVQNDAFDIEPHSIVQSQRQQQQQQHPDRTLGGSGSSSSPDGGVGSGVRRLVSEFGRSASIDDFDSPRSGNGNNNKNGRLFSTEIHNDSRTKHQQRESSPCIKSGGNPGVNTFNTSFNYWREVRTAFGSLRAQPLPSSYNHQHQHHYQHHMEEKFNTPTHSSKNSMHIISSSGKKANGGKTSSGSKFSFFSFEEDEDALDQFKAERLVYRKECKWPLRTDVIPEENKGKETKYSYDSSHNGNAAEFSRLSKLVEQTTTRLQEHSTVVEEICGGDQSMITTSAGLTDLKSFLSSHKLPPMSERPTPISKPKPIITKASSSSSSAAAASSEPPATPPRSTSKNAAGASPGGGLVRTSSVVSGMAAVVGAPGAGGRSRSGSNVSAVSNGTPRSTPSVSSHSKTTALVSDAQVLGSPSNIPSPADTEKLLVQHIIATINGVIKAINSFNVSSGAAPLETLDEQKLFTSYADRIPELVQKLKARLRKMETAATAAGVVIPHPPPLPKPPAAVSNSPAPSSLFSAAASSTTGTGTGTAAAGSSLFNAAGGKSGAASTPFATPASATGGNPFQQQQQQPAAQVTPQQIITAIYQQCNPSKMHELPTLLAKYQGKELEMVGKLEKKYNVSAEAIRAKLASAAVSPATTSFATAPAAAAAPTSSLFNSTPPSNNLAAGTTASIFAAPSSTIGSGPGMTPAISGFNPLQQQQQQSAAQITPQQIITAIYQQCNPSKMHELPTLLAKYQGKELEMVGKLEKKYNVSAEAIRAKLASSTTTTTATPTATATFAAPTWGTGAATSSLLSGGTQGLKPAASSLFGGSPSMSGAAATLTGGTQSPLNSNFLSGIQSPLNSNLLNGGGTVNIGSPFSNLNNKATLGSGGGVGVGIGGVAAMNTMNTGGGGSGAGLFGATTGTKPSTTPFGAPSSFPVAPSPAWGTAASVGLLGTPSPSQQQQQQLGIQQQPPPNAPVVQATAGNNNQQLQQVVYQIYQQYAPQKLANVPALLTKYQGREHDLIVKLGSTYNINVSGFLVGSGPTSAPTAPSVIGGGTTQWGANSAIISAAGGLFQPQQQQQQQQQQQHTPFGAAQQQQQQRTLLLGGGGGIFSTTGGGGLLGAAPPQAPPSLTVPGQPSAMTWGAQQQQQQQATKSLGGSSTLFGTTTNTTPMGMMGQQQQQQSGPFSNNNMSMWR